MFVRAKTIKGQKYAYLVENIWKKGKVKQVTKKYLGKIIPLEKVTTETQHLSSDLDKETYIRELLIRELCAYGFKKISKHKLVRDDLLLHLQKGSIRKGEKNCVLFLNERYLYSGNLRRLLDFYEPEAEDERPGTRLAAALSDIGIPLLPEEFVVLYKKIYSTETSL